MPGKFINMGTGKQTINKITCFTVVSLYCIGLFSQEPTYSYKSGSQLYLNPARVGNFYGDWRVNGSFRSSSRGVGEPFTTFSFGYDQHFYLFGREFGVGVFALNDKAGSLGISNQRLNFSLGHTLLVNNNNISIGIQTGLMIKSFPQQQNDYNRTSGQYENSTDLQISPLYQPDISLGAEWSTKILRIEPVVGMAAFHLNQPNDIITGSADMYGSKEKKPLKNLVYTKLGYDLNNTTLLEPFVYFFNTQESNALYPGFEITYKITGTRSAIKKVYAGGAYNLGFSESVDYVSVSAGATVRRMDIIFNYDINITNDISINSGNGFEIHIIYRSISTILNSYSIPCDRL